MLCKFLRLLAFPFLQSFSASWLLFTLVLLLALWVFKPWSNLSFGVLAYIICNLYLFRRMKRAKYSSRRCVFKRGLSLNGPLFILKQGKTNSLSLGYRCWVSSQAGNKWSFTSSLFFFCISLNSGISPLWPVRWLTGVWGVKRLPRFGTAPDTGTERQTVHGPSPFKVLMSC